MAASSVVFTLTPESNSEGAVLRDFVAAYRACERMQGVRRSLVSALTVCSVGAWIAAVEPRLLPGGWRTHHHRRPWKGF
jgi:hypothetical protein